MRGHERPHFKTLPAQAALVFSNVADYLDCLARRAPFEAQFRFRRHDGVYRWMKSSGVPRLTAKGEFMGYIGSTADIDDVKSAEESLRASEERVRLATEATGVGIWEWNVNTNIIRWDAQMFRLYGIAPTEDGNVRYSDWSGAVLPEDLARQEEILQDTVRRCGRSTREFRIRRRADGECRHIEAVETTRANAQGQTEWVVGTNLDITARKQAEEALRAAKEAAEAANQSKDRFLAVLSHELRTPLTPVLMAVGALEHDPELRPDVREDLVMIKRNIELETKLIDDLLDLNRIASGKLELKTEAVDLNEAVRHVCGICRAQLLEQNVRLETDFAADAGHIAADPARLQQVIWNVLKNAIKFTPGTGTIRVSTARPGADRCEVRVCDTGIGISPEVLPRIFDAFEQGDAGITRQFGGLGLGLAICKALVEMHHGTIRAESAGRGQGSTFTIVLPGQPAAPAGPPEATPAPAEVAKKIRLLVVEDHADTAATLARSLRRAGLAVTCAGSIAAALAAAERETFDVLVSDIGLPDGTGCDLMQRMRAIRPIPGIAMSGYGMDEDLRRSGEAGFTEHLVKPIEVPQLLAAIRRVTNTSA